MIILLKLAITIFFPSVTGMLIMVALENQYGYNHWSNKAGYWCLYGVLLSLCVLAASGIIFVWQQ